MVRDRGFAVNPHLRLIPGRHAPKIRPRMNVVGVSAYYHESACCLLRDGVLVAAAAEERFSRIKHDSSLPVSAFRFCLEAAGLDILDVGCIAFYETPAKKLSRQLWSGRPPRGRPWFDPLRPLREIREVLGFEGVIETFDHHLSHAASAYYFSGFDEAAVLTVDGVGEWACASYGVGLGNDLELLAQVEFPHSLGLFYSAITSYLGFEVNGGEYKIMGLAPYGQPRYQDLMRRILQFHDDGTIELDLRYFDFVLGRRMFSPALEQTLGAPAREPGSAITTFHHDVARSVQSRLEEVLLAMARHLHARTGSSNLCMAGGVALNCVANGRILREGPFEKLFVQPAAGDDGGALGAAALAHRRHTGGGLRLSGAFAPYLGPQFRAETIASLIDCTGIEAADYRGDEAGLLDATVMRLLDGQVVAWFHGAMEFGPRALGARSLLADPRRPDMRERLNASVKKRESFRPFAPSVLCSEASRHFDLEDDSPYMLLTCAVDSPLELPAVTHVDGSARPQTVNAQTTPRYAALLEAFYQASGCPILVNTSFNVRDEPIVCTPADALRCMADSDIDVLVLEDYLIDRPAIQATLGELLSAQHRNPVTRRSDDATLYTFV